MKSPRLTRLLIPAVVTIVIAAIGAHALRAADLRESKTTSRASADAARRDAELKAWGNALTVDPESAIALAHLAALHLQAAREAGSDADYVKAEQYARRSLDLRLNRNTATYSTLALALVAQHRFAEAESAATQALGFNEGSAQELSLLAEIKLELGDYSGARPIFDELARTRSTLSIAARQARWAELNGNVDEARRLLRRAVADADKRAELPGEQRAWFHYRLGEFEMRNGRFRRARSEFDAALAIQESDYRSLSALSRLALLEGNTREARKFGERALKVRLDPAVFGTLADADLADGDTASAEEKIRAMEVAVRGQPGAYHRAWSLFLLDHGRRLDEVHVNAASELETRKDIYGYDVLAWSLYRLGRFAEAGEAASHALTLGTRDASILYHAGMIEKANGRMSGARSLLVQSLKVNSRFDPTQARIARTALESLP